MTPAQHDSLNRFLATTVMGWKYYEYIKAYVPYEGCRLDECIYPHNFKPVERLADCEPLLDKIEKDGWLWEWSIVCSGRYWVTIESEEIYREAYAGSRTEALCLAIAVCQCHYGGVRYSWHAL